MPNAVEPPSESPTRLEAAYALLADADGGPWRPMAGGTDLMVQITGELGEPPERILDIWQLDELRGIAVEGDALVGVVDLPHALERAAAVGVVGDGELAVALADALGRVGLRDAEHAVRVLPLDRLEPALEPIAHGAEHALAGLAAAARPHLRVGAQHLGVGARDPAVAGGAVEVADVRSAAEVAAHRDAAVGTLDVDVRERGAGGSDGHGDPLWRKVLQLCGFLYPADRSAQKIGHFSPSGIMTLVNRLAVASLFPWT